MALMPGTVQRPVPNHGGPMGEVYGVVIHVTVGESSPYAEFANPANQVSAHFGILKDGTIEQYVDTANKSWAQGAGNTNYLSVETVGLPTEALTDAQVRGFARIIVWANQTYKVPLVITDTPGQRGLIDHGDGGVAWGNHPGCPGSLRSAQRTDIINLATPAPPPINEEDILTSYENTAGQTVIVGTVNGHTAVVTSGKDSKVTGGWSFVDVTAAIESAYPGVVVVVE